MPSGTDESAKGALPYDPDEWERKLSIAREKRQKIIAERLQSQIQSGNKQPKTAKRVVSSAESKTPPITGHRPAPAGLRANRVASTAEPKVLRRPRKGYRAPSVPLWKISAGVCLIAGLVIGFGLGSAMQPAKYAETVPQVEESAIRRSAESAVPAIIEDQSQPAPVVQASSAPMPEMARPEPPVKRETVIEPVPAVVTSVDADTAPASTASKPLTGKTIRVNFPREGSASELERVTRRLDGLGVTDWRRAPVPITISNTHVRYYHAGDRDAAAELGKSLGAPVKDFTAHNPKPSTGLLEVWIAGTAPEVPVTQASRRQHQQPPMDLEETVRQVSDNLRNLIQNIELPRN